MRLTCDSPSARAGTDRGGFRFDPWAAQEPDSTTRSRFGASGLAEPPSHRVIIYVTVRMFRTRLSPNDKERYA